LNDTDEKRDRRLARAKSALAALRPDEIEEVYRATKPSRGKRANHERNDALVALYDRLIATGTPSKEAATKAARIAFNQFPRKWKAPVDSLARQIRTLVRGRKALTPTILGSAGRI
jgi:hypothetical protein